MNIDRDSIDTAEDALSSVREYSDDIYFGQLKNFAGSNDFYCNALKEDTLLNYERKLIFLYKKYNLPIPALFGKKTPCTFLSKDKFHIDADMHIYKCELLLNHPEFRVGDLDEDGHIILNENFSHNVTWNPTTRTQCLECKLLPLCGGGCPSATIGATNHVNAYNCSSSEHELIERLKIYIDVNAE